MENGDARKTEGGDETLWWLNSLTTIRLATPELSVVEVQDPPNEEAPMHIHHSEDEIFVVLEGEIALEIGGERSVARPGDVVKGPRGVPHKYTSGPEGSRVLYLLQPGGFEEFIRATSEPAREASLPPAGVEPDWDGVMANLEKFDLEIVDP